MLTKNLESGQLALDPVLSEVHFDKGGRLHSLEGPAARYKDGTSVWFIEGVMFDPKTWEAIVNGTVTPDQAIKLTNVEQRRIAIQRIGQQRMLESLSAKAIDYDFDSVLYAVELFDDLEIITPWGRREPVTRRYLPAKFLKVRDTTTRNPYFLRVPPGTMRCREAKAWTFEVVEGFYELISET